MSFFQSVAIGLILLIKAKWALKMSVHNTTSVYTWDVPIPLFLEQLNSNGFAMTRGAKIRINLQKREALSTNSTYFNFDLNASSAQEGHLCLSEFIDPFIEIHLLNEKERDALLLEGDGTGKRCIDTATWPGIQKCFWYRQTTLKLTVPLRDPSNPNAHSLPFESALTLNEEKIGQDRYSLIIVNPCGFKYHVKGHISFVNTPKWGGHLDSTDSRYPRIILISIFQYLLILFIWAFHLFKKRKEAMIHHRFLSIWLSFRLIKMIALSLSLSAYQENGGHPYALNMWAYLYFLSGALDECTSLYFLFIVAMGVHLYRTQMNWKHMRVVLFSICAYGVSLFCKDLFCLNEKGPGGGYCHFVSLFSFILQCFLIVGIASLLNALISSVSAMISDKRTWTNESDLVCAYSLVNAHRSLRSAFYLSVAASLSFYILNVALFGRKWQDEWISAVFEYNLADPLIMAYFLFAFRPHSCFKHVQGIF